MMAIFIMDSSVKMSPAFYAEDIINDQDQDVIIRQVVAQDIRSYKLKTFYSYIIN